MPDNLLAGWRSAPFTAAGVTHDVFSRGSGPGVVLLPETPGHPTHGPAPR